MIGASDQERRLQRLQEIMDELMSLTDLQKALTGERAELIGSLHLHIFRNPKLRRSAFRRSCGIRPKT